MKFSLAVIMNHKTIKLKEIRIDSVTGKQNFQNIDEGNIDFNEREI